jgi:DNA-binding NtrC family response regulator
VNNLLSSVLIVDDDPGIRNMLSSVLSNEGFAVETASNGKEAVKTCEKTPFDVALIDIELPDMKGTELLKKLKQIQPRIVMIIITGHPTLESAVRAVNQSADGYLLKPFEVVDLLEMIKRLLDEKTNEYLRISAEIASEKEKTPTVKYQRSNRW